METKLPLVSVCIPCYKYPDILKRCLQSVIIQSYTNIEIIITDDSRDNVIKDMIKNEFFDERIQYIHNEVQKGSPANWNEGLKLSKGELVKIMHHDDWFSQNNSLEILVNGLLESGADFVFCDCTNIYPHKQQVHKVPPSFVKKWRLNNELILFANYIGDPSVTLFRTQNQILFDENSQWLVDSIFYFEYISKYNNFIHINKNLLNVTAGHTTQITNTLINKKLILNEFFYIYEKFIKKLDAKFIHKICMKEAIEKYSGHKKHLISYYYTVIKKIYFWV